MGFAHKTELMIDLTLVGDGANCCLDAIVRDINLMKTEAQEINDSIRYDCETKSSKTSIHIQSQVTLAILNEELVGLDSEVETIIVRLTRGSKKLDVIPIVGMPGLGKTTIANKVYSSLSVVSHFHVRAWCCVSQTYSKHSLLVQILGSIDSGSRNQYFEKDEVALEENLRQVLLRNRYLLVLDDFWDIEAWNLLERSLPDNANGSRILLTSRFQDLCLELKSDSKPHRLRQLTEEESWKLLRKKLYGKNECSTTMVEVGYQLAKSCRGLPLTIVLVAGILANVAEACREEAAKNLSSSVVLEGEDCMRTVELSYNHLPEYLKPCLLYFGAFREDEDIPCSKLIRILIGEGLVQQTDGMSLEQATNGYLMALSSRSLVMVAKQRTTGGAKAFQVHDLVREFCLKKSREESFLQVVEKHKEPLSLIRPSNPHRLCVYNTEELEESRLYFPNIRTLLFFEIDSRTSQKMKLRFWLPKLLRVMDLEYFPLDRSFLMEVFLLVHLRYLAIYLAETSIPQEIANLSRLESFQVHSDSYHVALPDSVWNIKTLRHLICSWDGFTFASDNLEQFPSLVHLQTLDLAIGPSPESLQKILTKLPSIRKLKVRRRPLTKFMGSDLGIFVFDFLSQLESLHFNDFAGYKGYGFKFPSNLKKLTLLETCLPWSEISAIGKLPNLEVLKLYAGSVIGDEWGTQEGEFPKLRFLTLCALDIQSWTASSENFSRLEKLVLENCERLEEVPSCLGECATLVRIEVANCRRSVINSVKNIWQEQMEMGNESLEIVIGSLAKQIYSREDYVSSEAESITSEGESSSTRHAW